MSSWLLVVLVAPVFAGFWLLVVRMIEGLTKMTHGERARRGEPRRSSRWGSADINGMYCRNCLKIDEYDDGYLLRSMWVFGGGEVWLPREAVRTGEHVRRFLQPRGRKVVCSQHRVTLYGRLLDFVSHRD
jgi:hypothetical protein